MCMIIDTDRLVAFAAETVDAAPIHWWLRKLLGNLVYSTGGKFETELKRVPEAKRRLEEYQRAGRARFVPPDSLREEVAGLETSELVRSNDAHVLALARVSGARLLYTGDKALMEDFRDLEIVPRPKGRVYSRAGNKRLLTRDACPRG